MKRTLFAAVLGGIIALASGVFTAQAAPAPAMTAPKAETSLAQTVGYGYAHRRHYRHHHYRPYVRYYAPRYYRPYYVAPRYYYYGPRHRHWSHRYHRRHYH
jgi:hypothetical protein